MVNTLARCGFTNVVGVGDGRQALAKCRAQRFDIILTDWNMPEMDGLALAIELRKMPSYEAVPIMMITTERGKRDIIDALTKGITSYIVKPFTADVLKRKMEDLITQCQ
jgi:two-component system chemotaxis response regulator CheY